MQRRHRLSRSRDFDAVYRQGKSVSTRSLVLYWFDRQDDHDAPPRVGIAVPRKVGGAVVRNRVKRVLRGLVLAGWRLLRCNPWSHGGYDPVSDQTLFKRRESSSAAASPPSRTA